MNMQPYLTPMRRFAGELFAGAQLSPANKNQVVQVFDVDSTLTADPYGPMPVITGKDHYFDLARDFPANEAVADLARMLHNKGDAIAIATARPAERLQETIDWLRRNNIPADQVILSTGKEPSGIAKQAMLQKLQDDYKLVGTLFDDSPFNIEGARLQGVDAVHLRTNQDYWDAHPEKVYKLTR